jgi:hypothetical protein
MDPGSEASQGDKVGVWLGVQMCLSMIVLWIAMHTGFHSPYPRGRRCAHVETVDRPITYCSISLLDDMYWTIHRFNMSDTCDNMSDTCDHEGRGK